MEQRSWFISDGAGYYALPEPISEERVLELAAHIFEKRVATGEPLCSPEQTKRILQARLAGNEREVFAGVFLDSRHRIILYEELFFGTIDGASVHPREVARFALKVNAAAVIFAHNHPSGVAEPSEADKALTKRLVDAMQLIDIRVLDHLVVTPSEVVSFAERGLI